MPLKNKSCEYLPKKGLFFCKLACSSKLFTRPCQFLTCIEYIGPNRDILQPLLVYVCTIKINMTGEGKDLNQVI